MKNEETHRLEGVAKELAVARDAIAADSAAREVSDAAADRHPVVEQRFFAPLTAGVFLPGERNRPIRTREPYISAFVKSDCSASDLRRFGVRVRSQACDLFTVFLPFSAIPRIEQSVAVHAIQLARPYFPQLDYARTFTQIDALQTGPPPVTGAGVIVGIIDTMLDIYHPDFRTAAGATRVRFLWDQWLTPIGAEAAPPKAPALPGFIPAGGATYGVEYNRTTVDAELNHGAGPAYAVVRHGGTAVEHGTLVAGIAAGNGLGQAGQTFRGAATKADIIFVSPQFSAPFTTGFADSAYVADGFSYIFARASQLGQPCVVNMSLGDRQGAHDGTDLGEQFLDNLLSVPGRAITLAAGNENNFGTHATGTVSVAGTTNLVLRYAAPPAGLNHMNDDLQIWYDGHDRITALVTGPMAAPKTVGPVAPGGTSTVTLSNGVQVTVTSILNDPRNGDNLVSVILRPPAGTNLTGDWTIALTGTVIVNGVFHAWIDYSNDNSGRGRWQAPHVQENTLTITPPSTARRPISVGNHEKAAPPTIQANSSRGPTRDGRIKPELATVGTNVTAPRSRDMNSATPGALYQTMSTGTSLAAPLVAGVCAQLFECRGAATTYAQLKQILTDTAATAGIGAVPGNAFGFGFMQAGSACSPPLPNVDVWLRDDASDMGVEPFTGAVAWLSPDIEIRDAAGNAVANPKHNPAARFNNRIRVTVRNRGTQIARNTEVFLYWADPATNIPFPTAWRATGIYTGAAPNFPNQSNQIVIPALAAAASQQIEFAWAPPAPGSNLSMDDHFCLLVRIENQANPSQLGAGGWTSITARNNIGLRNVHVLPNHTGGHADTGFYVVGSPEPDGLLVTGQVAAGTVALSLPVQALPWRDARLLEKHGLRPAYGCGDTFDDPVAKLERVLEGEEIAELTGIMGAQVVMLADGIATIVGEAQAAIVAPCLHVAEGAKMPVRLAVDGLETDEERRFVHVTQLAAGDVIGGFTLELRKGL